MSKKEKKFDRA